MTFLTVRTDQRMDPADPDRFRAALRSQGTLLSQHDDQLKSIDQGVRDLSGRQESFQTSVNSQVNHLADQLVRVLAHLEAGSQTVSAAAPLPEAVNPVIQGPTPSSCSRLASPEKFSGDSGDCRPFLVQCDLHYQHQPSAFPTDQSRIAFMITHLTGRAAAWATAEWARDSPLCRSLGLFTDSLKKIFDRTAPGREAAKALVQLKQRNQRVSDYAIEFRTIAADSGWNDLALLDAFVNGLSGLVKDHLVPLDLPEDLDSVIALAIRIDNRLWDRQKEREHPAVRSPSSRGPPRGIRMGEDSFPGVWIKPPLTTPSTTSEEPMQLGRARLSLEERERRLRQGLCFYCGHRGHLMAACSLKDGAPQARGGRW